MGNDQWKRRFTAPLTWQVDVAERRPDRGLVVANSGQTVQLHAWWVESGRLDPLTDDPFGVVDGWIDPTGSYVYHLADDTGSELGHLVRLPFTGGAAEDLTPDLPPYTLRGVGFDATGTRMAFNPVNGDGFALYTLDLDSRELRLLHRDSWEVQGALLSARGDLAACWSTAKAQGVRRYTLLVFDAVTGAQIGELDDGREAKVVGVRFSPVDGDDRLLATTTRSGFTRPVVWHPRTGARTDLELPELAGDVQPTDWSADGQRIVLCQLAGEQRLSVYDLGSGELRTLAHPHGTYVYPIVGGARFGGDDVIVGLRGLAETPPDVVELDATTGELRRTLLPPADAPAGRPWRSVTFESADGTPVQAWVATPEGDGPFPTILETHGGPHYTATEMYDPGVQFWLDHGYAWISVNFRGSLGFGRDFAEQIWGDLGRLELDDMVAARDWMVKEGIADPDRIFPFGASYGGYLTLFALGRRPDLWADGIAIAADADIAGSYEHSSDALKAAVRGWMRGTPSERPEAYARSSPITYVADVAAPVLVVQLRNDTRVPPQQMEWYEQRMREHGKDIEVIWLDGGHQSGGPDLLVSVFPKMLAFAESVGGRG